MQVQSKRQSLTTQIGWRVSLVSLIAVFGVLMIVVSGALVELIRSSRWLHTVATDTSHQLDLSLITVQSNLEALGITLQHTSDDEAALEAFLTRQPMVRSVSLIDRDGTAILRLDQAGRMPQVNLTEQPWLADETSYWAEPSQLPDGTPIVEFAVPVWGEDNNRSQTLLAEVDLTPLWDVVRSVRVNNGGYAYITNSEGRILAHRDTRLVRDGVIIQDVFGKSPEDMVIASNEVTSRIHTGINGSRVISSADALTTFPLFVVTEWAVSDILGRMVLPGLVMFLLSTGIIGLVFNVVRFTRVRITAPLRDLRQSVEAFRQGDMTRHIERKERHGDEIDMLIGTYNQMVDSINERTRDMLLANKKAEESSRLKTEFLSMVSHELRTPLNAIMGYSGILLEGLNGEMDATATQMVSRIDMNSQRLLGLINDLLDLSGIETGSITISQLTFDPHELALQWDEQYYVLAEGAGLTFDIQVDPQLPHKLYGDPKRITQVVANLISNSCKFTEKGAVTIQVDFHVTEWHIAVKDTGIGIPDDALQFIFERFRQVDGSATRLYGGTGLGLTIVEQLVSLMGGRVMVESKVGQGSTFTVCLPAVMRPQDIGRLYPTIGVG